MRITSKKLKSLKKYFSAAVLASALVGCAIPPSIESIEPKKEASSVILAPSNYKRCGYKVGVSDAETPDNESHKGNKIDELVCSQEKYARMIGTGGMGVKGSDISNQFFTMCWNHDHCYASSMATYGLSLEDCDTLAYYDALRACDSIINSERINFCECRAKTVYSGLARGVPPIAGNGKDFSSFDDNNYKNSILCEYTHNARAAHPYIFSGKFSMDSTTNLKEQLLLINTDTVYRNQITLTLYAKRSQNKLSVIRRDAVTINDADNNNSAADYLKYAPVIVSNIKHGDSVILYRRSDKKGLLLQEISWNNGVPAVTASFDADAITEDMRKAHADYKNKKYIFDNDWGNGLNNYPLLVLKEDSGNSKLVNFSMSRGKGFLRAFEKNPETHQWRISKDAWIQGICNPKWGEPLSSLWAQYFLGGQTAEYYGCFKYPALIMDINNDKTDDIVQVGRYRENPEKTVYIKSYGKVDGYKDSASVNIFEKKSDKKAYDKEHTGEDPSILQEFPLSNELTWNRASHPLLVGDIDHDGKQDIVSMYIKGKHSIEIPYILNPKGGAWQRNEKRDFFTVNLPETLGLDAQDFFVSPILGKEFSPNGGYGLLFMAELVHPDPNKPNSLFLLTTYFDKEWGFSYTIDSCLIKREPALRKRTVLAGKISNPNNDDLIIVQGTDSDPLVSLYTIKKGRWQDEGNTCKRFKVKV